MEVSGYPSCEGSHVRRLLVLSNEGVNVSERRAMMAIGHCLDELVVNAG